MAVTPRLYSDRLPPSDLSHRSHAICEILFSHVRKSLRGNSPVQFILGDQLVRSCEQLSTATPSKLKELISIYRDETHINYKNAIAFSAYDTTYFYKNLYKAFMTCAYVYDNFPEFFEMNNVIDLGCGSGTFGIAWSLFRDAATSSYGNTKLFFIDQSQFQTLLVGEMMKQLRIKNYTITQADVFSHYIMPENSVKLAGYMYCGFHGSFDKLPLSQINALFLPATVVFDYDNVIRWIARVLRSMNQAVQIARITALSPITSVELIGSKSTTANLLISGPYVGHD